MTGRDAQPSNRSVPGGRRAFTALAALSLLVASLAPSLTRVPFAPSTALSLVGGATLPKAGLPISLTPVAVTPPPGFEIPAGTGIWSLLYWSRGLRCQAYLVVPSTRDLLPLLVVLHGGFPLGLPYHDAQVYESAVAAAGSAQADGIVFAPNYGGYGPSQGTVGDTRDDLIDTVNGLKALRHVRGLHLAPNSTYLAGASLGGAIALMLAERDPGARAAILVSPWPGAVLALHWFAATFPHLTQDDVTGYNNLVDLQGYNADTTWYRMNSPDLARIHIPLLLIGGSHDPIVAPGMLRSLFAALRRHDRTVTLRFFPGGHGPQSPGVDSAEVDFLARYGLHLR